MGANKNPTTTAGDIIYASAANTGAPATLNRLAAGTDGYYLRSKGAAAPQWDSPSTVATAVTPYLGIPSEQITVITNGTAAGSYKIGQIVKNTQSSFTGFTITSSTYADVTGTASTITVTSGNWLVFAIGTLYFSSSGADYISVKLYDQTNGADLAEEPIALGNAINSSTNNYSGTFTLIGNLESSGSVTIGIRALKTANGSSTAGVRSGGLKLIAARIS